jgi:hypothetical protein
MAAARAADFAAAIWCRRLPVANRAPHPAGIFRPSIHVMEFSPGADVSALVADPRFYAALGIAVLSGVVRGFSGFGSALIYIPLASAVYGPKLAAASFVLIDFFCCIPLVVRAWPACDKREVMPLTIACALTIPLGALLLLYLDPIWLRWGIAALILGLLAVLVSGWRYRGRAPLPLTIGVGLFSGITGGATTLTGPIPIVYWLGSASGARVVRANLIMFFLFTDGLVALTYYFQGLMTAEAVALAILTGVPFLVALGAGARLFRGASERTYRRIAYAIVALAALVSLPLFDRVFR